MITKNRQLAIIFGVIFSAIVLYAFVRVFFVDDTARIKRIVYKVILAVESNDVDKCSSLVSAQYQDEYGNNKAGLLKLTKELLEKYSQLSIEVKQLNIEAKDLEAESMIGFMCYFKRANDKQDYYDRGKFKVYFKKEDKNWMVYKIEYSGFLELASWQGVV